LREADNGLKVPWLDPSVLRSFRIRTKLLIALIPSTILILIASGYATNWFSSQFINEAVQRGVRLQTLALAHELEISLNRCKEDLLELPQTRLTEPMLMEFWKSRKRVRGWEYAEVAYIANQNEDSIFLISANDTLTRVAPSDISLIRPDPQALFESMRSLGKDDVWISQVREVAYPLSTGVEARRRVVKRVVRFACWSIKEDGTPRGLIMLSISVFRLRDILSLFNSAESPIFAVIRSPEVRYSYLLDTEGWIWFQSEEVQGRSKDLSTQMARTGFSGTFGKPDLKCAFKPFIEHERYWNMVSDIQQGKHGLMTMSDRGSDRSSMTDTFYVGYAPVQFVFARDRNPAVFAGVAYVDRSRLGRWAGYRQIDVIFVLTLCATLLISLLIYGLGRIITKPMFNLAAAVNDIQETGELTEIRLRDRDYETSFLRYSINKMLSTIRGQMEVIRLRDQQIRDSSDREKARLEDEIRVLKHGFLFQGVPEIVGLGPAIESLKTAILKAAAVDADVLIIGETGTGKQLAAEAIHKNSSRADKAFVSINCGALDENLLLDELFGHTKGAFTEARTERKGAFLAADGGTLFLDEIANASLKVQQALLRAIAMRKISPLGSDREFDVDVRLIAATNEELKDLTDNGRFREDLYYRLNVITIRTPALRDHRENIPVLAHHFLTEVGRLMNKRYIGLSQGALEKMKAYQWPGNIREFKNSLTRAITMAEGSLIHTHDVQLEGDGGTVSNAVFEDVTQVRPTNTSGHGKQSIPPVSDVRLNERQQKAYDYILHKGEISRTDYQQLIGNGLPRRTAQHDLRDMVTKGLMERTGRGPSIRYRLVGREDAS
jgi:DNA-binding NtrC family response regulator